MAYAPDGVNKVLWHRKPGDRQFQGLSAPDDPIRLHPTVLKGQTLTTLWAVELEAEGDGTEPDDTALGRFAAALEDYEPAVAAAGPTRDRGPRYEVTLWLEALDPADALSAAREAFRLAVKDSGLPDWSLVSMAVMSEPAFDADHDSRAFPPLLGVSELGDLLGVSRQRASIVAKSPTFPRPVAILQAGPVWSEPSVRRFIDEWERKPGRPRRDGSNNESA